MKDRIRFVVSNPGGAGWLVLGLLLCGTATHTAYPVSALTENRNSLIQSTEAAIFIKLNEARTKHDLPELAWASDVAEVARSHSEDMAAHEYFSHVNREGERVWTRLEKAGIVFTASAENLFQSNDFTGIGEEAIRQWMDSPDHRENILNPGYTDTGVGIYRSDQGNLYYITQVFIKRALGVNPPSSRLSDREIDTIYDIIKSSIKESEHEFNDSAVRKRIVKRVERLGISVKEDIYIEGLLRNTPVMGLTIDMLFGDGFIVNFTEDIPDAELGLYGRLVHTQGYSAAVFIKETDGQVRFPIIRVKQAELKNDRGY